VKSRRPVACDDGNAIVEFLFVAVLVLVPLVYLVVAVASVQRGRLAVTNAARDVGRTIASAGTSTGGVQSDGVESDVDARARAALRIALLNQGVPPDEVRLRYVAAAAPCDGQPIFPDPSPGSEFAVCVIRHHRLPAVPTVLEGRGVTEIGRYVVHIDEFRSAR
jgi:Flp pilus assembly protein TadG